MTQHRVLVAGVGGRMGRAVVREALAAAETEIAGGFEHPESPHVGCDIGMLAGSDPIGVSVDSDPAAGLGRATAMIDFTTPAASLDNARAAAACGVAHVIGATGFTPDQDDEIARLAEHIAIVKSGNMSLGVNLLAALVRESARRLGVAYDIEIIEAHHRGKIDAPSGTALMLGAAAATGRGIDLKNHSVHVREGLTGARLDGAIGFAVVRGGGIVGDHEVLFAGPHEVISLAHRALDRALFARGALAAAMWTLGKPPGLYTMSDVLGFGAASA